MRCVGPLLCSHIAIALGCYEVSTYLDEQLVIEMPYDLNSLASTPE